MEEKRHKIKIDLDKIERELKEELKSELIGANIKELLVIDFSRRSIELQSARESMSSLITKSKQIDKHFFNSLTKKPSYVR